MHQGEFHRAKQGLYDMLVADRLQVFKMCKHNTRQAKLKEEPFAGIWRKFHQDQCSTHSLSGCS